MRAWPTVGLGDLASFRNGLNYTDANNGAGLAVIGVSDFQDRVVADLTTLSQLSMSALSTPDALVKKDDILFVRSNGNRALIGRSLFVKTEPVVATSHSGFTIRCRFADARCEPRFFAYLFRGHLIRQTLSAQGGGTNISNLNQGILSNLQVPLPPPFEQRRIADMLSAYDDLIENNTRRITILEEMARRIFEEWFVHFRAPGCEGLPLVASELGPIPKGWTWSRLRDLADEFRDPADPRTLASGTPYIGLEHIPRRSSTFVDWGQCADVTSLKLKFRVGDILFSKIRPYFHKCAVAPIEGVASSDAIVIRPKTRRVRALVTALTSSDAFVAHSVATSNGTKMPRADWKVLRDYPVAIPPSLIGDQFETAVWPMIECASRHAAQSRNLRAQRDLLLPQLISGEIDVTEAEALPQAAE